MAKRSKASRDVTPWFSRNIPDNILDKRLPPLPLSSSSSSSSSSSLPIGDRTDQKAPIKELRKQAEDSISSDKIPAQVEDMEEMLLSNKVATSLTLVNDPDLPDFGSDDSDGPPSDEGEGVAL